jgi:release factor glutamine methyltransferase
LEDLERIVDESAEWLVGDGVVVVELAPAQAASVAERARAAGFADVEVRPDLAGRDRMVVARLSG